MKSAASRYNRFAEFTVFPSKRGNPTAMHCPSGLSLHSRVDPVAEARIIAESINNKSRNILLIGGGLGYLPEQLLTCNNSAEIHVLEPFTELVALTKRTRPNCEYLTNHRIIRYAVGRLSQFQRTIRDISHPVIPIIAPYMPLLTMHLQNPLSDLLQHFRSERASQGVYGRLLREHDHDCRTDSLPFALSATTGYKAIVVCGAGPSLIHCVDALQECRKDICVVAASGAVPALLNNNIVPDWTIALEAREQILHDLKDLPRSARIIVFSCTHPSVISQHNSNIYSGNHDSDGLETRGGSSVVPALDFATRLAVNSVILCGVDLSYRQGFYATGSKREDQYDNKVAVPKFAAMRLGLESLIYRRKHATIAAIYHAVFDDSVHLRGTEPVNVRQLSKVLYSSHSSHHYAK